MKVKIGPYKNWIGPYQIAEILCFWAKNSEEEYIKSEGTRYPRWVFNFGEWLSEDKHGNNSFLTKFCQFIEDRRHRKVKVKVHGYDAWGADHTLAIVIAPVLRELRDQKCGAAFVDDEDVPENLRSTAAGPKENNWDTDENWFPRWYWILEEMIWSFEQIADPNSEDQFFNKDNTFNAEDIDAWNERITNGTRLFGKYYRALWT